MVMCLVRRRIARDHLSASRLTRTYEDQETGKKKMAVVRAGRYMTARCYGTERRPVWQTSETGEGDLVMLWLAYRLHDTRAVCDGSFLRLCAAVSQHEARRGAAESQP